MHHPRSTTCQKVNYTNVHLKPTLTLTDTQRITHLPSLLGSLIILISISQSLKLLQKMGVIVLHVQRDKFLRRGTTHESFQVPQSPAAKFKKKKVTEYNPPVIFENYLRKF